MRGDVERNNGGERGEDERVGGEIDWHECDDELDDDD